MNITFFGTYNTQTTPRIQVLIEGLRAHDVAVNECNAPLKISTRQRVAILKQPWRIPQLVLAIISCWTRLIFRRHKVPPSQAVIVGHLGQFDIHLARLLFAKQCIVLDYMISAGDTARDRGVRRGFKLKLLTWLDNAALRAADIVLVDTEEHRLRVPKVHRHKVVVALVGAPNDWLKTAHQPSRGEHPLRVIFFGKYTPLQGTPTIGKALGLLKIPMEITMVGRGQDERVAKQSATKKEGRANITWINWVEPSKLPKLVARHDVCLGIFGSGPKAYRVVPNKIYQGAAVGCALVTSDTPPQKRILKDAALFVTPDDPQALASALEQLAAQPAEVSRLQQAAHTLAWRNFIPKIVVQPLLDRLFAATNSSA